MAKGDALKIEMPNGMTAICSKRFAADYQRGEHHEQVDDMAAMLAKQKIINDAHDKIVELAPADYHRLNFGKLD